MYLGAAMFFCKKHACFPTIVALELEEDDYNKGCGRTIQKQTTLDQDINFFCKHLLYLSHFSYIMIMHVGLRILKVIL